MKILRVIASVNPRGGGPIEGIRQTTPLLSELGHTTEVVSLDDPSAPWLAEFPLPVHALGPGRGTYAYSPHLAPWLQKNSARFDVVIVHGIWQYSSFGAWRALHGTQTPYFVYTHGMLDPWFKRTYPLKHLKKCLYWPWAVLPVLRDARAVLFTSEEERRLARQSFTPYKCREIVLNYGTSSPAGDPETLRRQFYASYPALQGRRLLLFLGRIHPKKGCDLLLKAFSQAATDSTLHLVMAGPCETKWQAELEILTQTLGIADRVTWTGMVAAEQKWSAFYAADAFILPSHQENFGIAVAEALACGLPVLISDKINIWREIIADGAGLVAPDTEEGTAHLLRSWLALTPEQTQEMRRQARACFLSRFEIKEAVHSLEGVLNASLGGGSSPEEPRFRQLNSADA